MSSEIMSKLGIICPCFKPIFKKKKGTYNFETPREGGKVDDQNNAIIVHSKNNRVEIDRQSERAGERTTATTTTTTRAEWDRQTNTVQVTGGIENGTVDLDELKEKGEKGEIAAVHHDTWLDRQRERQKVAEEIGGGIVQNGTLDLDRQTSDALAATTDDVDVVVADVPKAQSRLERLLEASSREEGETEEKDRHIVGRGPRITGEENVKEQLIVVDNSAGLQAYSPYGGGGGSSSGYSSGRSADPVRDLENMSDITEIFQEISEGRQEIDAYQLQSILNNCFTQEFDFAGFSDDLCRSMVAMHDNDLSGRLSYHEFKALWEDLQGWKETYVEHDADGNGYFDQAEFADILEQIGLSVNENIVHALTIRYSDREGHVRFDDFVACAVKLKTAITTFKDNSDGGDEAEFTTDQFIQLGMYT